MFSIKYVRHELHQNGKIKNYMLTIQTEQTRIGVVIDKENLTDFAKSTMDALNAMIHNGKE